ncbi:MAG: enoyl-CoA hydratase/isomerase family protein [Chloroflexi bacterium]|nr:enoyl-CoA hydratase/isomerase family protein [Chloroflexota bacterium]
MAVLTEQANAALWITISRPEAHNAISSELVDQLIGALDRAESDGEVRVLVLTGAGNAFCAGADLKDAFSDLNSSEDHLSSFLERARRLLSRLRSCPKPMIAAINGLAIAGGLELALCCDIVIAAESARLGDGHANYGLLPGGGGAVLLPRLAGTRRAKYILFTGDTFSAREMLVAGIVNQVVPDTQLREATQALADKIASKSPLGIRYLKRIVDDGIELPLETALRLENETFATYQHSADLAVGLRAFVEKRKPEFLGR